MSSESSLGPPQTASRLRFRPPGALASPVTFAPPQRTELAAEQTHAGMRAKRELCAREMFDERWRTWLPAENDLNKILGRCMKTCDQHNINDPFLRMQSAT